jgi:hypothetical protein
MSGFTRGFRAVNPPPPRISNPSYKVFNPTEISLHPSYFVWKSLTLTPNPCRNSLSGAACTPLEIFPPTSFKKNENPPLVWMMGKYYYIPSVKVHVFMHLIEWEPTIRIHFLLITSWIFLYPGSLALMIQDKRWLAYDSWEWGCRAMEIFMT